MTLREFSKALSLIDSGVARIMDVEDQEIADLADTIYDALCSLYEIENDWSIAKAKDPLMDVRRMGGMEEDI